VDAAIIFADLLLPVEPMGLKLRFVEGEGPVIENPVRTSEDVDALSISNTEDLGYVGEAIQMVVKALAGRVPGDRLRRRPVHAGQLHDRRRSLADLPEDQADDVLGRDPVASPDGQAGGRALGDFGLLQVTAGARAIQVFDTWVGALGPDDYCALRGAVLAGADRTLRSSGVPGDPLRHRAGGFYPRAARRGLRRAGGGLAGPIDQAWMDVSYRCAIQGNLDPAVLLAPLPELKMRVHELLKRTGTRPGHILNVGHGILPETPVEHVKAVVGYVREFKL
jgi:uroporphyrinogen decarboxylase